MARWVRRLRGVVLRLVLDRRLSIAVGAVLLLSATVLLIGSYPWESWITDGSSLVLAATGAALILVGLSGRRPDWYE